MKQQTCNSVQPTGGLFAKQKHFNWREGKGGHNFPSAVSRLQRGSFSNGRNQQRYYKHRNLKGTITFAVSMPTF